MTGVNKAIVLGHLGGEPTVRRTQAGAAIVSFNVATSETWRDKATGERKEKTDWHRVVIFNEGLAKVAEQYLKKGSKVYLEGKMVTRKWTDAGGVERYTTEVVLGPYNATLTLLDRAAGKPPDGAASDYDGSGAAAGGPAPAPAADAIDDEIPF